MKRPELTPEQFHDGDAPVYDSPGQTQPEACHYRHADGMAVVNYPGSHGGQGKLSGRWVFCEEPGKAEGVLQSGIELFMDSVLEPHATIGLHRHSDTEEIYYLLEGSLQIQLTLACGETLEKTLHAGDAHLIQPGQQHVVKAGAQGARIIVVAAAVRGAGQ